MKTKPIIIDKSAFVGINLDDLCNFANNHFLILPLVLHDECATNQKEGQALLRRFQRLIASGGNICQEGRYIVEKEGQTLRPYGLLANHDETERWRKAFEEGKILAVPPDIGNVRKSHKDSARITLDLHEKVTDEIGGEKFRIAANEVRKSAVNRHERFKIWVRVVDTLDIHRIAACVLTKFTNTPDKYCLSADWVTWHYLRISTICTFEYTFLKGKPGKNQQRNAEHDLQDEEYVWLLSRADGLLTRDKKLISSLAKAAFPEKDVFSNLNEVTEDYKCNWVQ